MTPLHNAYDVAVIGAGPAGSIAALSLARLGSRVLLVDKSTFPRPKVCGACLNSRAVAALRGLKLDSTLSRLGPVTLSRFRVQGWGRSASLPLPEGWALSRGALDAALVEVAIDAGCHVRMGHRATLTDRVGNDWAIQFRGEFSSGTTTTMARIVIDASGLAGGVWRDVPQVARHSRIGAGTTLEPSEHDFEPGVIHMAIGPGGYTGIVVQEDGRLNVASALDPGMVANAGGVARASAGVLVAAGLRVPERFHDAAWKGTPTLTRFRPAVDVPGLFRIGDAAGYVEPFTGEGMAWAIAGAVALAPIADRAIDGWSDQLAAEWQHTHRHLVRRRQRTCRLVSQLLFRPMLARLTVQVLSRFPGIVRPFVRGMI